MGKLTRTPPRTKDGKFRKLNKRERIERGLRHKVVVHGRILHDENEEIMRARLKKENLMALMALVRHHPNRVPEWIRKAAGGPKGPAGA